MFQNAIRRHAQAKAVLGHGIDGFGVGNALGNNVGRFAYQRHLQPVAQLSGPVFTDHHRRLAAVRQKAADRLHHGGRRLLALHQFHQRHEVRRVPEMRADQMSACAAAPAKFRDAESAGGGDKNRFALPRVGQSSKQTHFLAHLLRDR